MHDVPSALPQTRRSATWRADLPYLLTSWAAALLALELAGLGLARATASAATSAALLAVVPVAALAMYTRLAVGIGPAFGQVLALCLAVPWLAGGTAAFGLRTLAAGLVGAAFITVRTSRATVLSAGLWAGAAGALLSLATVPPETTWPSGLSLIGGSLLGGMLSGTAVLVLSPLAERLFGHVTPLTLLEVLNYDHPLLRQIMTAAPGTFLHSINLAVLADAAARAIGADALSVRVGALYHDAGKIVSPAHFVENQRAHNPHDQLAPEESARILRAHVADGAGLVEQHRLGRRVRDFVQEHHGTTVMHYFADKAGADGAALGAFRYPGPRPQSRETAVLMIGDQVEATARASALETLDDCRALVAETVARLDEDAQFEESGLTPDDLATATEAFARTVHAMHHRRVAYPARARPPRRLRVPSVIRRIGGRRSG